MTSPDPNGTSSITPEHVQNAGLYIQQTAQSLLTGVRATDTDVDGLLTGWQGPASDRFGPGEPKYAPASPASPASWAR